MCTWSKLKFNTSQLDFGNGSALWYFHHSDISGFYFLSNCTAWCVLRGFHENDESLISTMLQLWGNMEIHFESVHSWVAWNNRNRKQKQGTRVKMANRNSTVFKIPAGLWERILTAKIPNTLNVSNAEAWPHYLEVVYGATISQTVVSALFYIQQP